MRERHGRVVRGIYYTLQAQEELAADAALAAEKLTTWKIEPQTGRCTEHQH